MRFYYFILRLKSRLGGWLEQFVCDTVLTYKEVTCAPVLDKSLLNRTMTTFEWEYIFVPFSF
jgi:hypothetical protein